jgi:iron complex transport system substrate-binding protein
MSSDVSRRLSVILVLSVACVSTAACVQEAARIVTDSTGRRVEVPPKISRVLAAGPPASILLYTLAVEKMIAWVRTPSPAEKEFLVRERTRAARAWAVNGARGYS